MPSTTARRIALGIECLVLVVLVVLAITDPGYRDMTHGLITAVDIALLLVTVG